MSNEDPPGWVKCILHEGDPANAWDCIFTQLQALSVQASKASALDKATILPDRLLSETAWVLWEEFPQHAPSIIQELKRFWVKLTGAGTAFLLLDGLSLRELPWILKGAEQRGIPLTRVNVFRSEVPSDTVRFARCLGLNSRSELLNNQAPAAFIFKGTDTFTDVLDAPFADCIGSVPSSPRLFLWHKWPDEPLIHLHSDKANGPEVVARETKNQLTSDGFWKFLDRLRQGRRLVVTSDHGYAVSSSFSSELTDGNSVKLLREFFGAKRWATEIAGKPWPRHHLPPLVTHHDGHLVVTGQRKWAVQGGFPHLCHGGLSLLEVSLPFIEFPPLETSGAIP